MSWRQPAWDKICEFTTKPTYDLHDEYMVSKAITDEHPKIHNSGDDVKRDMQTRHCIALGKLTETEARLKAARQFMSKRRVNLDEQWGELTRQEEELRENFIAFSSFIKENDEKCARAKSKINEMLALTSTRATENIQLQKEVEVLQETKTRMDATIKKYYIYEKFLQKVMEAYPDVFKSLNEVIYRYDALMNARGQLETLNEYRLRELEIAKAQFDKAIDRHLVSVSGLQNKINDLEKRFETAENECLKWERFHQNVSLQAMEKLKEVISVKNEIWLLYKDICKRRKMKPVHKDDFAKQLEVIKNTLGLLEVVKSKIRSMEKEKRVYSVQGIASNSTA